MDVSPPAGQERDWPGLSHRNCMKVLCFGSLNLDYTYHVEHFVKSSQTLAASLLEMFCGGKGLNQSIALAKAGADTYHAGAIGMEGMILKQSLEQAGVHTDYVSLLDACRTGHAIIQVDPAGENCILLYGGANQAITPAMAKQVLSHFEAGDWLVLQNEISALPEIMETAMEKGMHVVFSPAPMSASVFQLPLHRLDYLLLNRIEACTLLEMDETAAQDASLADALSSAYPQVQIVLTLGAKGAVYIFGNQRIWQPAFPVKTVDTTGAGDTFAGYFTACRMEGMDALPALEMASAAAAFSVQYQGAAASIPFRAQAQAFLDTQKSV